MKPWEPLERDMKQLGRREEHEPLTSPDWWMIWGLLWLFFLGFVGIVGSVVWYFRDTLLWWV